MTYSTPSHSPETMSAVRRNTTDKIQLRWAQHKVVVHAFQSPDDIQHGKYLASVVTYWQRESDLSDAWIRRTDVR
jgi:hypothetical protein